MDIEAGVHKNAFPLLEEPIVKSEFDGLEAPSDCAPPLFFRDLDTNFSDVFPSLEDGAFCDDAHLLAQPSTPALSEAAVPVGDYDSSSSPFRQDAWSPQSQSPPPAVPNSDEDEPDSKRKKPNSGKRKRSKSNGVITKKEIEELAKKGLPEEVARMADGPMTPAQHLILKKQRRLIRNRESAMLSRQRKREYVDGLEDRVTRAEAENAELHKKVAELTSRNEKLTSEITHLRELLQIESPFANIMSSVQEQSKILSHSGVPQNAKTAGVCFMILLFSFGMFYNPPGKDNTPMVFQRDSLAEVVPSVTSDRTYIGRGVLSTEDSAESTAQRLHTPSRVFHRETAQMVEASEGPSKAQNDPVMVEAFHKLRHMMKEQKDTHQKQQAAPAATPSAAHGKGVRGDQDSTAVVVHDNTSKSPGVNKPLHPDPSAYVVCGQAQGFVPENATVSADSGKDGELPVVSLLLPASTLPAGVSAGTAAPPRADGMEMLHLSCQLLDIQTIPLGSNSSAVVS